MSNASIHVTPLGVVEIKEIRQDLSVHYNCIAPGQDYSNELAAVKAACGEAHTPEIISAYRALLARQKP